jgi:hypothetical protein
MTDPINNIDASSLSEADRVEIERLRAAYDRGGPRAVAGGIANLAKNRPDLFDWLLRKLAE